MKRGLAALGLATLATVGVACSGCPGVGGQAEEVPVELEWPDASTLGPVQAIDPTAAPPTPVDSDPEAAQPADAAAPPQADQAPADADGAE